MRLHAISRVSRAKRGDGWKKGVEVIQGLNDHAKRLRKLPLLDRHLHASEKPCRTVVYRKESIVKPRGKHIRTLGDLGPRRPHEKDLVRGHANRETGETRDRVAPEKRKTGGNSATDNTFGSSQLLSRRS